MSVEPGWNVVTRAELESGGLTRWGVERAVRSGVLEPLGRGVYRLGTPSGPAEVWQAEAAAAGARRPDAAVTGQAAAALRRLDGFPPGVPITLAVSRSASGRGRAVRRLTRLDPVVDLGGITCTGIDETLLDLGGDLTPRPGCPGALVPLEPTELVELAVEDALRRGLTTVESLADIVTRANPARPGRRVLADVLRARPPGTPPTESYLETRCVQVLRRAGLPDFDRQVEIHDTDGFIGRVDLFRSGVVVELVGRAWHLDRFDGDHRRYARLAAAGYIVLPFTFSDVEHRPDHVTGATAAALTGRPPA